MKEEKLDMPEQSLWKKDMKLKNIIGDLDN